MPTIAEQAYDGVTAYLAEHPNATQKAAFEVIAERLGSTPNSIGVAYYKERQTRQTRESRNGSRRSVAEPASRDRRRRERREAERRTTQTDPPADVSGPTLSESLESLSRAVRAVSESASRGRSDVSWSGL